jgi:4-coumarate--CoA ligase
MVILPAYSLPILCETIQKYKISFIHIVPPQLLQLAKREEVSGYDLSTLEEVVCGAAPFSYLTVRELQERLKKKILVKNACRSTPRLCFLLTLIFVARSSHSLGGMSEISPGGTGCFSDRPNPEGSIGVPLPSVRIRIVDPDTLKDVEEGKEGEIWIAGRFLRWLGIG